MRTYDVQIIYTRKKVPTVIVNGITGKLVKRSVRLTYRFNRFFLKLDIAVPDDETIQFHTARELLIWERYKDTKFRKYLCPIVANGRCEKGCVWVIQPRCVYNKKNREKYQDFLKVERQVQKMDITDLSTDQCGYIGEKLVFYDYGFFYVHNTLDEVKEMLNESEII